MRATNDEVDQEHRQMYSHVAQMIQAQPDRSSHVIHFLNISKHLEWIADHTCNIAEDVLCITKGEIFRHGHAVLAADAV